VAAGTRYCDGCVGKEAPTEDLDWWTRDKKTSFSKQINDYARKKDAAESALTAEAEAEVGRWTTVCILIGRGCSSGTLYEGVLNGGQ
jgi:hypothetical protein